MQINEIIKKLDEADDAYYNDGESSLSDEEYDSLKDQLVKLSPNHPRLSKIGHQVNASEWKDEKHKIEMSSLNKVNTISEFIKWTSEISDQTYMIMDKLDGMSLDLEYEDGVLKKAITRGDGIIGCDIFQNARKMKNVKTKIPGFDGSLRGEVVLLVDDFEVINAELKRANEKQFSNPRNSATGIAKRFDGRFSDKLSILFYDCSLDYDTEEGKLQSLEKLGLKTCFWKVGNVKQMTTIFQDYEENKRINLKYDVDGMVIRADNIELQKSHGLLGDRPKACIAWKFKPMQRETKINDVVWSIGKNRRITPVAELETVQIGGVKVSNASLHNYEIFSNLNLGKNDTILVSRRNDVIPAVEKVIVKNGGRKFQHPTLCPVCNHPTEMDGPFLTCQNDECPALYLGNLYKWIDGLEIMNIGKSIIEKLYLSGCIKNPADFYKLEISDIATLEGLGEKSAVKILKHLHEKMELTLPELIGNLNMKNFAKSRVEMIVEAGYDTLDKILNISTEQLVKIKGIEQKTARSILDGLMAKKSTIERLLKNGIKIKQVKKEQTILKSGKLIGQSYCFTGGIMKCDENGNRYTRDMMEQLVLDNGGKIGSVNKNLSYLVQADPNSESSKSQKAKALGISILSEESFFKMIS